MIRGIIGTHFNSQIKKIIHAAASDRGLKVTTITDAENKKHVTTDAKEYFRLVDCIEIATKRQKCCSVKISINKNRQAILEWGDVS